MKQFLQTLRPELEQVNGIISERLSSQIPLVEEIGEHLIAAGGKRLRPLLVILAHKICEGRPQKAVFELATVIEFLHTATLLHDDVIDVSELRRGRPTANATWGNAPSVLVGDFLYSRAFQMLVDLGQLNIMQVLANATNLIAEGEVLQLTKAGKADTSEQEYMQVIQYKTATLFEAAGRTGAQLAGASEAQIDALGRYGHHIGMAFQLMDDVLDYQGDAEVMGKNVGDDLSEGKPTLPLIEAMRRAESADATLIADSIRNKSAEHISRINTIVTECGAIDYTYQRALEHSQMAAQEMQLFSNPETAEALGTLAKLATERNY
jgi:octaprenyl-diphosphate synthase